MPPCAATVDRAAIGLAAMLVAGNYAGSGAACDCAVFRTKRVLTLLRRSRGRTGVGFSAAIHEIQREDTR